MMWADVIVLAIWFPIQNLAEFTSQVVLAIWTLTNAALILLKLRGVPAPADGFITPIWVPVVGLLLSLAFIVISAIA